MGSPRVGPVTSHLAQAPAEPEELSPKELTALVRKQVKDHLELHTQVHALKRFVHDEHVVPELEELDDRLDAVEATTSAVKSGLEALQTVGHATGQQVAAISRHLGVPVVKGLTE